MSQECRIWITPNLNLNPTKNDATNHIYDTFMFVVILNITQLFFQKSWLLYNSKSRNRILHLHRLQCCTNYLNNLFAEPLLKVFKFDVWTNAFP